MRSPLAASSALKTNPQSLIIGELPAGDVFHAIAATFRALNWRGGNPFRIALFAMTPNIVAIGFCDRPTHVTLAIPATPEATLNAIDQVRSE